MLIKISLNSVPNNMWCTNFGSKCFKARSMYNLKYLKHTLLLLLLSFFVFKFEYCSGNKSLNKINSPKLIDGSHQFILYFYGDFLHFHQRHFQIWHESQQIILTSTFNQTLSYRFAKNSDLVSVVFFLINKSETQVGISSQFLKAMRNLLMSTNTLLVLLTTNSQVTFSRVLKNDWINKCFANTPVLKVLFTFLKSYSLSKTNVICTPYCTSVQSITDLGIDWLQNLTKQNIFDMHKAYFYSMNNQAISSHIIYQSATFLDETKSKNFLCDRIYKFRLYKLFRSASYCWAKQMLASEIAKVHNVTFLKNKGTSLETSFFSQDRNANLNLEWYEGLHLQYYSGWSYFYCLDKRPNGTNSELKFNVWISPMSLPTWIVFIFIWLLASTFLYFKSSRNSLCTATLDKWTSFITNLIFILRVLTKPNDVLSKRNCFNCILLLAGVFLSSRYENQITSVVTAELKQKAYATIAEFLDNGYRMAEGSKAEGTLKTCYNQNNPLSNQYYCVRDQHLRFYDYVKLKLGWARSARWQHWWLYKYKADFKKMYGPTLDCFHVQEDVEAKPWFLVIYTTNRYWMIQSVERVHEGGFMSKWNDWAQYATNNFDRETYYKNDEGVMKPDIIDQVKLWPVLVLCGGILIASVFVLLIERFGFCLSIINTYFKNLLTCHTIA